MIRLLPGDRQMRSRYCIAVTAVAGALLASAPIAQAAAATCEQLNGTTIPRSAIGMPTTGASVTTATVAAAGTGNAAVGEYCRASVAIHPVDPKAPDILAQVNLPSDWNRKALMFGGGGYDGSIPTTTGNYFNGPVDRPVPL